MLTKKFAFFCYLLLLVGLSGTTIAKSKFVVMPSENVLDIPNGQKIATVANGTALEIIEEKGSWTKISLSGWVPTASLNEDANQTVQEHLRQSPAGSGFTYANVSFFNGALGTEFHGEITNKSERDYQLANFVLSVYDADERLLDTSYIMVSNISVGNTKSFQTFLLNAAVNQVKSYKIQFENGL